MSIYEDSSLMPQMLGSLRDPQNSISSPWLSFILIEIKDKRVGHLGDQNTISVVNKAVLENETDIDWQVTLLTLMPRIGQTCLVTGTVLVRGLACMCAEEGAEENHAMLPGDSCLPKGEKGLSSGILFLL